MQVRVNERIGSCGCGRSPTGDCCGWHVLSEDEYKIRLSEWQAKNDNTGTNKNEYQDVLSTEQSIEDYRKWAQDLWFSDGSCTGGKAE